MQNIHWEILGTYGLSYTHEFNSQCLLIYFTDKM